MEKIEIDVGRSLGQVGAGFAASWTAAEAGGPIAAASRIHFRDWAALCAVLTPERFDLLRHLRREPASGVEALGRALGRDIDRLRDDLAALAEIGLVTRAKDGSVTAPFDEIASTIRFAA